MEPLRRGRWRIGACCPVSISISITDVLPSSPACAKMSEFLFTVAAPRRPGRQTAPLSPRAAGSIDHASAVPGTCSSTLSSSTAAAESEAIFVFRGTFIVLSDEFRGTPVPSHLTGKPLSWPQKNFSPSKWFEENAGLTRATAGRGSDPPLRRTRPMTICWDRGGICMLWTTTCFELPLQHNSVRHYGEQRESRRKNDGEHAPIKTVARKNIVRKMSQIYADMTTAPFRILHGGKILN